MLEGARDGRQLVSAVETAVARNKSVVILKMGQSGAGLAQAASHTGALAGKAELFDAELRHAGACVVRDETELLDAMVIGAHRKVPAGRGFGIVTSSGGFGVLTLDAAEKYGLNVRPPAIAPTVDELNEVKGGRFNNPFDYSSSLSAGPRAAETALGWMISQPNVDSIVMFHFYSALREDRQAKLFSLLADAARSTTKPIFVCGVAPQEFEEKLRALGVLWFEEPTRLVKTLALMAPRKSPGALQPVPSSSQSQKVTLTGARARQSLEHLPHLRHVATYPVADAAAAKALQKNLRSKIILKVESDQHAHKSDLGLVSAPLDANDIDDAFQRLVQAHDACGASGTPIVAQPFERGCELALGAYLDPIFGPAVMVATGGIFLEILQDATFAAAPITHARALEMIRGLAGSPLLSGARGRAIADLDAAAAALVDLSHFIYEGRDKFSEVDINPLIVREQGKGVVAVDALLVLKKECSADSVVFAQR